MMIKSVPPDLRTRFKILCLERGSNMSAQIVAYMEREVEKADKRKTAKR